jgi:hypothetical protein
MRIKIEYESSWRNSFLDGDNNEPLPKKGRNFITSMSELKKEGNYKSRKVELSTVMGILNRLIGDQRKLYQSRQDDAYYFADIEPFVSFRDQPSNVSNEVVYIRNMNGSNDQNSFTGMIRVNDPIFLSDYAKEFWGVLWLSFSELCQFIINEGFKVNADNSVDPILVIKQLESLDKEIPVEVLNDSKSAYESLLATFEGQDYLNPKGLLKPIMLYCSALYIQLHRLESRFDMESAKSKAGGISGISKRGFTKKDFMYRYTTGSKKIIWGNPYMKKERIKGLGEVTSILTKASGLLTIDLDIEKKRAEDLKNIIEMAGVSSFYLGKKGLAYVSDDIRI